MASSTASLSIRRRVSSAAASRQPQHLAEIKLFLDSLETSASDPDILVRLKWLSLLKRILVDSQEAKDTFRALKGFNSLLSTLHSLSGFYGPTRRTEEEKNHFIELIKCLLGVISEALQNHLGNRRFFTRRIGWDSLEQGFAATGLPTEAPDYLFGVLLAFGMDDATLSSVFVSTKRGLVEETKKQSWRDCDKKANAVKYVRKRIERGFGSKDILLNAEIVPLIMNFLLAMPQGDGYEITTVIVLQVLLSVAKASKFNLVAMHSTGILSTILKRAWDKNVSDIEKTVLQDLAQYLIRLGINKLDDAKDIYRKAMSHDGIAEFLLEAIKTSRDPPHIQFDLSLHGYSSMELSSLGRTFPPVNTPGYSFSAWIHIESFDPSAHTTLFGIFDSSQRCFVLAYIEQETRKFIWQTSVSSPRASVRFKSTVFEPKKWYHLCIVHRKGRATSSAKTALHVNGEFVEQVKSAYPSPPPSSTTPVQVFFGTPSDLAPRVGRNVVQSRWSLGTAHIFEDILSDDLIAVHYRLGPRYHGNFQDCLGSFQTYEASAALNMRNELMHPGREEKSDIIAAIRQKASTILPEGKVLLNLSATQVLDDRNDNNIDESVLLRSLSAVASKNLQSHTRSGAIAINGSISSIDDALISSNGIAVMTGEPIVVIPQSLDEAAWRIGGAAAVGLKLVEVAKTPIQVCRAVEILFEIIKDSWRNSEAMERENGFAVLSNLIRRKDAHGVVGKDLLRSVLKFVGYRHDAPEESLIINPLAYRILLVDFDVWRKADMQTQKEYFSQFTTFTSGSKYHHFNSKRLVRMRIVKKLLFALKGEIFAREILPDFLAAFKSLVRTNMSADVLRSLSLFITYSLHKQNPNRPLRVKKSNITLRRQATGGLPTSTTPRVGNAITGGLNDDSVFTRQQLGVLVLETYHDLLCEDGNGTGNLKKFAKTVTNKWLLYLLAENDPKVVVLATKILARLLVVHGDSYVAKFARKTGGFIVMKNRLKRWWNVAPLWPICFSILFGHDVTGIDIERPLELFSLLEAFSKDGKARVVYPDILPVISAMLKVGLVVIAADRPEIPPKDMRKNAGLAPEVLRVSRRRSMSVNDQASPRAQGKMSEKRIAELTKMLQTVIQFIAHLHTTCPPFREFCVNSEFIREIFGILFPVVCSSDNVSAETELNSRDSALTFDGGDVVIRPLVSNHLAPPIVRTITVEDHPPSPTGTRSSERLRSGSSFILVTQEPGEYGPSSARLAPGAGSGLNMKANPNGSNSLIESLMELVTSVFLEMVFGGQNFAGFFLPTKIPPGFQEHQIYFETYLLRHTVNQMKTYLSFDMKKLCEPKVLTNVSRFATHVTDCMYEGWFLNGAEILLDFIGHLLEYLQRSDIAKLKSVRLCSQSVAVLRMSMSRIVLFRLSELDDPKTEPKLIVDFLAKMMFWQTVILSPDNTNGEFTKLICYLLYTRLIDERRDIKVAACEMLRTVLVQKPETLDLLNQAKSVNHKQLSSGFRKLLELDNDTWLYWIDDHRVELDAFFYGDVSKSWETFVIEENRKTEEIKKGRMAKRREKLKQWIMDDMNNEDVYGRHESVSTNWSAGIYSSEHLKFQRATQDLHDSLAFIVAQYAKLESDLTRPCGFLDDHQIVRWRLDLTEGRNRMRKRMLPDRQGHLHNYQPKRRLTGNAGSSSLGLGKARPHALSVDGDEISITTRDPDSLSQNEGSGARDGGEDDLDDDYELVDDPREDEHGWEDKNRKVIRSLQHGDMVEFVHNVSRLVGLDAVEGLLILGKNCLYLIDNFFQRADGEIVNVWQAPKDERDQYLQIISGKASDDTKPVSAEHETRSWPFDDIISISKRRFLFRDVALELFFSDGRSYLLTTMSVRDRDALHAKLVSKAVNINHNQNSNDGWRSEALRVQESPTNLGSKLAHVFASGTQNPATKRWVKGEISNFHYLMLVNTMAGRTFNDLTQYPVFPWVLADYTSEELDLTNPRTFRDFSKPMGAQTIERQREFRDRYRAFEEMASDQVQPPFHYGTHFSSAMIVCSYLIRLQPFVQSYLLLQGGQFDHADRLFYSLEKAWKSASKENSTDVRELIPEFFFLPEFLVNSNGYNFGMKQGSDELIDDVALPPWAKGDPKIFIAKHREALESSYVSQHLHEWIDLVFGFKQRGEAAIEATNVFHHLSYHGAIDLDKITDSVERMATIGIIHNFGQTPHQVFTRGHAQKERNLTHGVRLDVGVESLIRLPFPLLDSREKVQSLVYSPKYEKVFCAGPFRLNVPPQYDKYMEWGFADASIRFYQLDSKKLIGHHEHLHPGQLSCAKFADSKTLITAGTDGTVSVWHVVLTSKQIELHHKTTLFGHVQPVTTMAVSRGFSTLITCSNDKVVIVWDLNRLRFVRTLKIDGPVQRAGINDITGDIMLCSGPQISMFTINGKLMFSQTLCESLDDTVISCAFYEGSGNEWLERELIFTGHRRGIVNVWEKRIGKNGFELKMIKTLQHVNQFQSEIMVQASITEILPMPHAVYTGDEAGRVYEWDCQLVQRNQSPTLRR